MLSRTGLALRSSWIVVVPVIVAARFTTGWTRGALIGFLAYYLWTRLVQIVGDWPVIRYSADSSGLTVRSGLLAPTTQRITWSAVTSVTLSDTLWERLSGCADVLCSVTAAETGVVRVPGLSRVEGRRLVRLHAAGRSPDWSNRVLFVAAGAENGDESVGVVTGTSLTQPLRMRDHALLGVESGRFLLVIPGALGLVDHVRSLMPGTWITPFAVTSSPLLLVLGVMLGTVVAVLYGTAVSLLRFHRFTVTTDGRTLAFSAGFLNREQRSVPLDSVVAISSEQNLLLRVFRRTRLRCFDAGSAGRLTGGMLAPSMDESGVADLISQFAPGLQVGRTPLQSLLGPIALALASVSATVTLLSLGHPLLGAVCFTSLSAGALITGFVGRLRAHVELDTAEGQGWIALRRGSWTNRDWYLRSQAIDLVTERSVRVGARSLLIVTVAIRAHRTRRIHLALTDRSMVERVRVFAEQREGTTPWTLLRN